MKICFKTWITDSHKDSLGITELTNQLKHYHPDIPHLIYGDKEMNEDRDKYPWMDVYPTHGVMYPISAMKYIDDYDLIIHVDGDSTVVGPLNEWFEGDYDAACVRNNHFGGGAGKGDLITIPEVPTWDKFLNVGMHAIRSKEFLEDWLDGCHKGAIVSRTNTHAWDDENNEFNRSFYNGKFNGKIMDDVGSGVSFGLTNVFGTRTHWDSWRELYMKGGEVMQINPIGEEVKVSVMHMAGGGGAKSQVFGNQNMRQWLNGWVKPEVAEHINKISNG